ncbi:MAG: peptidoglycan editing factor PgeF [Lachnospiraceae bacterium]|nr:peptidoglycan editing factor PgeF [Lachnospiraceae bacterium]
MKYKNDNHEIIKLNTGDVPYLYYPRLEEVDFIKHCFTTREGGVSEGMFSSLNLSFTRGDDENAVIENYRRLADEIGCDIGDFVCTDQTHTTNIIRVGRDDRGYGVTREKPYRDVDGLVTDEPGVVLSTFYADCMPLYFVDPVNKAIGLSHSGWRGTVARMGRATLEKMAEEFGTKPEDVIAAIGPSICQDCYEVSEDVAEEFYKEFGDAVNNCDVADGGDWGLNLNSRVNEILSYGKAAGKYQLNLWRANEIVLAEAGVKVENIVTTNVCTCCNPDILFSHRASKGKRGNLGAFMYIRR